MRGGYRPNSGPRKGTKYRPRSPKTDATAPAKPRKKRQQKATAQEPEHSKGDNVKLTEEKVLPLDYMLKVINDPAETDKARKDRLAVAAAPYCHPRKGEAGTGKKDELKDEADKAGKGKFASMANRLKVVK